MLPKLRSSQKAVKRNEEDTPLGSVELMLFAEKRYQRLLVGSRPMCNIYDMLVEKLLQAEEYPEEEITESTNRV